MRTLLCAALLPLATLIVTAQEEEPAPFGAEAILIMSRDEVVPIWIMAATKNEIRYREGRVAIGSTDMKISKAKSIYLMEPKEFTQAVDLFQARKYAEAKAKFAAIKTLYKSMEAMPGNHSALAAFYEMECMRKLGDLEGLAAAAAKFIKDPLTRDFQRSQVDLYVFWDAVRTKGWARIDALAKEREAERLPNFLRAQIGYCHGLALEALGKPTRALNAYNIALTADSGASEELTRQAALNIMRIHKADPGVQLAIKLWGTPDENKNTQGYYRLLEAASVAKLYGSILGGGTPLPVEYKALLKYVESDDKAAAKAPEKPTDKAADKEADKPAAKEADKEEE